MNPKEKAEELIKQFNNINDALILVSREEVKMDVAKKCATICIDQIVNEIELYLDEDAIAFEYWNECKEELEKL